MIDWVVDRNIFVINWFLYVQWHENSLPGIAAYAQPVETLAPAAQPVPP